MGPRETRPRALISKCEIYIGEWLVGTDIREGRGISIWKDGSMYEGYYKNNLSYSIGRLLHSDGDIYHGEFKNSKADGLGYYLHKDGSCFRGFWKEDKQHGRGF